MGIFILQLLMARRYQHGIWDVILHINQERKIVNIFILIQIFRCLVFKNKTDIEPLLEML